MKINVSSKKFKKIVSIIATLSVLGGVYFFGIPAVVNIDKYRNVIEKSVNDKLSANLKLGKLSLEMTWNLGFKLKADNLLFTHPNKKAFINSGNSSLEISLPDLLFKKVIIREINIDKMNASLHRAKNGKLDLIELIPLKSTQPQLYKVGFENSVINLTNSKINYNDSYHYGTFRSGLKLSFDAKRINISELTPGKYLNAEILGRISGLDAADFNIDSHVSYDFIHNLFNVYWLKLNGDGVDVSYRLKYAKLHGKRPDFDIQMFFKNTDAQKLLSIVPDDLPTPEDIIKKLKMYKIRGKANGYLRIVSGAPKPQLFGEIRGSNVNLLGLPSKDLNANAKVTFTGKTIHLDVKADLPKKGKLTVKGDIRALGDKKINLDIISNTLDMASAQKVLLAIRDIFDFKLGPVPDMTLKGNGNIWLKIRGKSKHPRMWGDLKFWNASGTYNKLADSVSDARGEIVFDDTKIRYKNIAGSVKGNKIFVNGYNTLDTESFSDVNIFLPSVDLKMGKSFIERSKLLYKLKNSLDDIVEANGRAKLFIHLKGTEENLLAEGALTGTGISGRYRDFYFPITDAVGVIKFIDEKVIFQNVRGRMAGSTAVANGYINGKKNLEITLKSDNINLADVRKLIKLSPILYKTEKAMAEIVDMSGNAAGTLSFLGPVEGDSFKSLDAKVIDGKLFSIYSKSPVTHLNGNLFITMDSIAANSMNGKVDGLPFLLDGKITGLPHQFIPNLTIKTPYISAFTLVNAIKNTTFARDYNKQIEVFKDTKGQLSVNAKVVGRNINGSLSFQDFKTIYKPFGMPISLNNGVLKIAGDSIYISDLTGKLAHSDFDITGSVSNYASTNPRLNLTLDSKLHSSDLDKFFYAILEYPIHTTGILPVTAGITGNLDNFNLSVKSTLGKNGNIKYFEDVGITSEKNRNISLLLQRNLSGTHAYFDVTSDDGIKKYLLAEGYINKKETGESYLDNFTITVPDPINIRLLNPTYSSKPLFSEGTFFGDVTLNGLLESPKITGKLSIANAKIPEYSIIINNSDILFNENDIEIDKTNIQMADSKADIRASLSNVFDTPLLVQDLEINSPTLNVDKILEVVNTANKGESSDFTKNLPPIVVSEGIIKADELIAGNVITNNASAKFNFTPDWVLTVPDISFNVAGGNSYGQAYYNFKSSQASADITAKNILANAAASTLLNLPNEVYGVLNGRVQFTTSGKTPVDLLNNADGQANFVITDGRLVRLGSLEYLLRAVNVLQSGVGGFNINNIIDLVVPQKTGYFNTLEGSLVAKDGILHADKVLSKGNNLSLNLSGSIDMASNIADIKITGDLSKKVSGLLGPLGSISINQFIDYIPGLGFLPTGDQKGLLYKIPGIQYVPGLGLDNGGKYRRFAVDIEGDLYDQKSYKKFRWIN